MAITPTKQQQKIIDRDGSLVVRACPGSGKTFTVAARMARLLETWVKPNQGIAAISFTNVAWQEIEKYLIEEFNIYRPRKYPHFVGTIDSFLNTYIFLPFGHLVMECIGRPELIGPPYDEYEPLKYSPEAECQQNLRNEYTPCGLNIFSFDDTGNFVSFNNKSHFKDCTLGHVYCEALKRKTIKGGQACQLDAIYYAFELLRKYPKIAKAIVNRFPIMIVDEAQDTSILQMKLLDNLKENGLKELMLVGDPDQAIFEWRTAEPEVFLEKCRNEPLPEYLKENLRSTQAICDFANSFTQNKMTATNPERTNIQVEPKDMIWSYQNDKELPKIIERFIDYCTERRIEASQVSVLVRGKKTIKKITPGSVQETRLRPWKKGYETTQDICRSKYLFEKGEFEPAFKTFERAVCRSLNNNRFCRADDMKRRIDILGFEEWRGTLFELLSSLPSTDISLGEWIQKANVVLQSKPITSKLQLGITKDSKRQGKSYAHSQIKFDELFSNPETLSMMTEYKIGTVHSVKGQTLDAVLLIVKGQAGDRKDYPSLLRLDMADNEELRIVYVAITRAAKLLVLAVPEKHKQAWEKKFFG